MMGEMKNDIESMERENKLRRLITDLIDKSEKRGVYKNFKDESHSKDQLIKDSTKRINKIKNDIIEMFEVGK